MSSLLVMAEGNSQGGKDPDTVPLAPDTSVMSSAQKEDGLRNYRSNVVNCKLGL